MQITTTGVGKDVIPALQNGQFDLVILDLGLPDIDGFDLLKAIRKNWPQLPVIILSGKQGADRKAIGFELEADDYLTKPYSTIELIARIKRHIRRSRSTSLVQPDKPDELRCKDFKLNLKTCLLIKNDKQIVLPAKIFKILKFFMEHPAQVFSKEQLYERCWDDGYFDSNTVHVYINKLRQLIENTPNNPNHLITVIGLGYRFDL